MSGMKHSLDTVWPQTVRGGENLFLPCKMSQGALGSDCLANQGHEWMDGNESHYYDMCL